MAEATDSFHLSADEILATVRFGPLVEGLAQRIITGAVPETLRDYRVLALDLGLLQAGAGMRGELSRYLRGVVPDQRLKARVNELCSAKPVRNATSTSDWRPSATSRRATSRRASSTSDW